MTDRDEDGFTLIEVVVAAAIMLAVVVAAAQAVTSVSKSSAANDRRDKATTAAYRVLEKAKAFGCGLATGSATGGETQSVLSALKAKCWNSLSDATVTDGGSVARFHTQWSVTGAAPGACSALTSQQPDTLIRQVAVAYTNYGGATTNRVVSTREALPPDAAGYNLIGRGGIVVSGVAAGTTVTLRANGTTGWADVTRGPDSAGCVWFPFLSPGNYSLTNSTGSPSYPTQTVNAGTQNSV
ncbi:MAG TPA: prepilin-type N-terminal cleavage/methylation domain-containing protein [Acidimicrobiales bacterium]|nr:prepilin-type N-terminal cleavage/methylation domain-containing protein [Acidimicrobiales bacterium]